MKQENRKKFIEGIKDGTPIGLAYFAVSFSLGIIAKKAGLSPIDGFIASMLNMASAGEYVGFTLMAAGASYIEMAVMILITNARYLLMSCSLSQKLRPNEKLIHRLGVGYLVTDEIFGIAVNQEGDLNPFYSYGAGAVAIRYGHLAQLWEYWPAIFCQSVWYQLYRLRYMACSWGLLFPLPRRIR